MGFEYGLHDDFVVQFDAVQTQDRINITIGDEPATIDGDRSLSVFFRAPAGRIRKSGFSRRPRGRSIPDFTPASPPLPVAQLRRPLQSPRETADGLGRPPVPRHDRSGRHHPGTDSRATHLGQPPLDQPIRDGRRLHGKGEGRVWTDNFRVGSPQEAEQ